MIFTTIKEKTNFNNQENNLNRNFTKDDIQMTNNHIHTQNTA